MIYRKMCVCKLNMKETISLQTSSYLNSWHNRQRAFKLLLTSLKSATKNHRYHQQLYLTVNPMKVLYKWLNAWKYSRLQGCYATCYGRQHFKMMQTHWSPNSLKSASFVEKVTGLCLTPEQCDPWNCGSAVLHTYIFCSWSSAPTPIQNAAKHTGARRPSRAKEAMNEQERGSSISYRQSQQGTD